MLSPLESSYRSIIIIGLDYPGVGYRLDRSAVVTSGEVKFAMEELLELGKTCYRVGRQPNDFNPETRGFIASMKSTR